MQFLKFSKYISQISVSVILIFITLNIITLEATAQKKYVIVLDAGHGGKDPGNLGNGYKEKKIALNVALETGKELSKFKDIEVVYTRKKDVFIELHNRAKIANKKKADLFVSIHCDAFHSARPHGASTFVLGLNGNKENLEIAKRENAVILMEDDYKQNYDYNPNSPESVIGLSLLQEENLDNSLELAGLIQNNFVALKRNNRRVKQNNFLVLRQTVMPSVLVELGFLTNKNEGRFLNSKAGQVKMAKSIAKAIKKYVDILKLNDVNAVTVTKPKTVKKEPTISFKLPETKKNSSKATAKKNVAKKVAKTPSVVKSSVKKQGVIFMVQIAASRKKLTKNNFSFRGLTNIEMKIIDNYYKYYNGSTSSITEIRKVLKTTRSIGFKDAFLVAFKNGTKISIKEALKSQ